MAVTAVSSKRFFLTPASLRWWLRYWPHALVVQALQVRAADDPGGERGGAAVGELVDEAALAGEDQRQIGFGVLVELADRVQLGRRPPGAASEASSMTSATFIFLASTNSTIGLSDRAGEHGLGGGASFDAELG